MVIKTLMITLPIEPYWANAITWYLEHISGNIKQFHAWLSGQGVIGLPRKVFTPYLEFDNEYNAIIFRIKWGHD